MSVIGRLDEQVDALLIAPLAGKGDRGAQKTDASAPGKNRAQPQTPTPTNNEIEGPADAAASREELPVWLL